MENYYINSNKWKPIRDKGIEELRKLFRLFHRNEELTHIYYTVSNHNSPTEAKIQCLRCNTYNIAGESNYCPNCGIKFNKDE